MKTLVLAEKPSVARDITRVLHCSKKLNGALEGNQYIVTWALGHLVTLADPEAYDKKYKVWDMQDLPMLPRRMKLVVIPQTSKQFNAVKAQMTRSDVKDIVIATDAGREGELVARWIILKSGIKKPLKRLWISSVTDKAIKDGFAHLKDAKAYESLFHSAVARSEADWLVGINATRALTCKHNAQLSCGRVQTPTLAMIAFREEQIKQFKPQSFYGLQAVTNHIKWTWRNAKNETSSFNQAEIQSLKQTLENQPLKVKEVQRKIKKSYAPLLYDLTELQRDANRLYGYSAKETLNIMQSLYENHKVLTYPRTDSRYLTDDIVPTLKERLQASLIGDYDDIITLLLKAPLKKQAHFVNNAKVSDHHAIIPTEQPAYPETFSEREKKIYHLVLKRFLAVLLPAYQYEDMTLYAAIQNESFIAKGRIQLDLGWKKVYQNDVLDEDDEIQSLPDISARQSLSVDQLVLTEGKTKAPAYFTEATLLSAMENPVAFMQSHNQKLHQTLKETGGLGTVATLADIIEKLYNTFLIEKYQQEIHVSAKGKQLLNLAPKDLCSPELTARWELELSKIAKGQLHSQKFLQEIKSYTQKIITEINSSETKFKHDNLTRKKCPKCDAFLLEVNGKKGKMLVCSNRECHYKEKISIITNARCPNCHQKLELVGKDDKQMFICKKCGYRQGMAAFKKEREERKNTAGKNDVRKYMQKQKQEAKRQIEDSPFAALLGLKDKI